MLDKIIICIVFIVNIYALANTDLDSLPLEFKIAYLFLLIWCILKTDIDIDIQIGNRKEDDKNV